MIKRLIFDLDNTLIMWKEKYKDAIKNTINYYNLDIDYLKVDELIEEYENYYDFYSKENMAQLFNKKFNLNIEIDFIEKWLEELSYMSDSDEELVKTLKYLKSKYELIVLTNWFKESQENRLKNAGIYDYFKSIYGGDKYIKPNPLAFKIAMENRMPNECIMIGDNYKVDIEGALNIGMKTIMVTKEDIEEKEGLIIIKDINELRRIL